MGIGENCGIEHLERGHERMVRGERSPPDADRLLTGPTSAVVE